MLSRAYDMSAPATIHVSIDYLERLKAKCVFSQEYLDAELEAKKQYFEPVEKVYATTMFEMLDKVMQKAKEGYTVESKYHQVVIGANYFEITLTLPEHQQAPLLAALFQETEEAYRAQIQANKQAYAHAYAQYEIQLMREKELKEADEKAKKLFESVLKKALAETQSL